MVAAAQMVPLWGVTARLRLHRSHHKKRRKEHLTLSWRKGYWDISLIWVCHCPWTPLPSQMNSTVYVPSQRQKVERKELKSLFRTEFILNLLSSFAFSLTEWIIRQSYMHPEPAVKILRSGAHWGPAAHLSLFILYLLPVSRGSSGPHQTVGHDWVWSGCPEEWSQEKGGRSDPPQKSSGLFVLAGGLRFSYTHFVHVFDTGVLHPAGRGFRVREQHWQEESEQQRSGFPRRHGDRESPEPAVH